MIRGGERVMGWLHMFGGGTVSVQEIKCRLLWVSIILQKTYKPFYHQFVMLCHSSCSQAMPTRRQSLLLLFAAAVAVLLLSSVWKMWDEILFFRKSCREIWQALSDDKVNSSEMKMGMLLTGLLQNLYMPPARPWCCLLLQTCTRVYMQKTRARTHTPTHTRLHCFWCFL